MARTSRKIEATVVAGKREYIPSRAEIVVGPDAADLLGIGLWRRRCDLRVGGETFSVRVGRSHSTDDAVAPSDIRVRIPLVLRMFTGASLGSHVVIERRAPRSLRAWWRDVQGRVRWPEAWPRKGHALEALIGAIGLVLLVRRRLHHGLDFLLRLFLRAPTFCFSSQKAYPGDDPLDVVRIHRSACEALGVTPGGQVVLSWRGRSTLVRAVEDIDIGATDQIADQIRGVGSVHQIDEHDDSLRLPRTLVVHVGSRVRAQLGMPPDTVVEIRRSVTSAVAGQLSSFVFTLVAIVLSAVGLPDQPHRWWIAAGVGVVGTIFALGSVRVPRSSHGLWP